MFHSTASLSSLPGRSAAGYAGARKLQVPFTGWYYQELCQMVEECQL